jgi:hypothetical protein
LMGQDFRGAPVEMTDAKGRGEERAAPPVLNCPIYLIAICHLPLL